MNADLTYPLQHDGDSVPVVGSLTLGRHIDNDVVIAGEDVLDYHLRVELNERGPQVLPLGNSNFTVNGQELDHGVGLVVGDLLGVGSASLVVGVSVNSPHPFELGDWSMINRGALPNWDLTWWSGRHPDCGLQVESEHVSRRHARLIQVSHAL